MEERRKGVAKQVVIGCVVTVAIVSLIALGWRLYTGDLIMVVALAIMTIPTCGFLVKSITEGFVRAYKNDVVSAVVGFVSPDLTYLPQEGISLARYRASGLCPAGVVRCTGEDMIRGTVGQTPIEFSELHAKRKSQPPGSRGEGRPQWNTVFQGLFFIAEFNKHFRGRTFVFPDTAEKLLGKLGHALQGWDESNGDLVKLEDPAFEREFAVFSTDQVEARYILSPALMRRMLEFKSKAGAAVTFSFVGGEVYIAISTVLNRFEPRLFGSVLDLDLARGILNDLTFALGVVEDLNLNTRIWTKA